MKNSERVMVYGVGFLLGTLLVSTILSRRAAREEAAVDPWVTHNAEAIAGGAAPLPAAMPAAMHKGRIIDFGYLPNEASPVERVWHLNFEDSYPYVRVVEDLTDNSFTYMAADQISIKLVDGVDVTELKPMLADLGLRMRMFNRKEDLAVIGVLDTQVDAVPRTIDAVQAWSDLFESAEPDWLRFQNQ